MIFRGDKAHKYVNLFEIRYDYYDILSNPKDSSPIFIQIKPLNGPWLNTDLTHRFDTREAAETFCGDIAAGKISFDTLRKEWEKA